MGMLYYYNIMSCVVLIIIIETTLECVSCFSYNYCRASVYTGLRVNTRLFSSRLIASLSRCFEPSITKVSTHSLLCVCLVSVSCRHHDVCTILCPRLVISNRAQPPRDSNRAQNEPVLRVFYYYCTVLYCIVLVCLCISVR